MSTRYLIVFIVTVLTMAGPARASEPFIVQTRGVDSRVDYRQLTRFGPWDDRNYGLTAEDLALFADNEDELAVAVPAFFRVELRRSIPDMPTTGSVQYPRSALPKFLLAHGGYLVDGRYYRTSRRDPVQRTYSVVLEKGLTDEDLAKALDGESRVTSPVGAAESAVAINPTDPSRVIAGTNGPGWEQVMHVSSDGGRTWQEVALPYGNTCCDPTVGWSSDGSLAYAATLGATAGVWVYRSADNGQSWTDLATVTAGDARRELGGSASDKEYLHVDTSPASPHRDNVYLTWHDNGIMKFARSTDQAHTWTVQTVSSGSSQLGIGSDITTDRAGNVYYAWPADASRTIWVRRSTNGGASFEPAVAAAITQAAYEFPIPSMDSRRVFVYVAAAADHSTGPHGGNVYLAWTDSTTSTSSNPTSNHARVQVATSTDGGGTWTVTTPHETADQSSVDRWHPWLAVDPSGTVHVTFYDTRRDPTRQSVDVFHSLSTDGGLTWSQPGRLTGVMSPSIGDDFQFGDYNGLDAVDGQFLAIFTDNRNEAGGGADSVDVYVAGEVGSGGSIFGDGFEGGDTSAWSSSG